MPSLDPAASSPPPAGSTHERLLEAALHLFAERGYGGASMAELALAVGVRKASLYNYYPSKDDLLLDLVMRSAALWREVSIRALEGAGSFAERLRAHLEAAVDFAVRRPDDVAVIRLAATQVGGDLGRKVRERLDAGKRESQLLLESFFSEAQEAGEIRRGNPRDQTLFWRAFLDGVLINQLFALPGRESYLQRLPQLWEMAWDSLRERSGE